MAALLAGIAGAAARLKKRGSAMSGGGEVPCAAYEYERDLFVERMTVRVDEAGRKIEALGAQINEAEIQCKILKEYFGESGLILESHRIFSILKNFTDILAQSIRAYEQSHGRIVVVRNTRRSAEFSTSAYGIEKENRMWAVNTSIATKFGPGIIQAVRVKEHMHMVRFKWGIAFLQNDAIIDVNCTVATPYGCGRVVAIDVNEDQITNTFYKVELLWCYAVLQPESIAWSGDVCCTCGDRGICNDEDSDASLSLCSEIEDNGAWNDTINAGLTDDSESFLSDSDAELDVDAEMF
jgi:hypothetical protein